VALDTNPPETVLYKRYAVYVLVLMLDSDKCKLNEIRGYIKSYSTLVDLIESLVQSGLVKKSEPVGRYRTTYVSLTDEGREIAALLKDANDRCSRLDRCSQQSQESAKA